MTFLSFTKSHERFRLQKKSGAKLFKGLVFALISTIVIGCGQGAIPGVDAASTVVSQPPAVIQGIVNAPHIEPPFRRSNGAIAPVQVPGSTNTFRSSETTTYSGASN